MMNILWPHVSWNNWLMSTLQTLKLYTSRGIISWGKIRIYIIPWLNIWTISDVLHGKWKISQCLRLTFRGEKETLESLSTAGWCQATCRTQTTTSTSDCVQWHQVVEQCHSGYHIDMKRWEIIPLSSSSGAPISEHSHHKACMFNTKVTGLLKKRS